MPNDMMATDPDQPLEREGAAPAPVLLPETPAAPGDGLTFKRGLLAALWILLLQIACGFIGGIIVTILNHGHTDKAGTAAIVIWSVLASNILVLLWGWRNVRRFGAAHAAAVGWGPSRLPIAETLSFGVLAFIGVKVASALYAMVALSDSSHVQGAAEQMIVATSKDGIGQTIVTWVAMVAVGPVAEEMIFRGYLQTALTRRLGAFWGIALATAAFATFHFSLLLWPLYFFIGLGAALLYHRTGSIRVSAGFHILNNLFALVALAAGWTQT